MPSKTHPSDNKSVTEKPKGKVTKPETKTPHKEKDKSELSKTQKKDNKTSSPKTKDIAKDTKEPKEAKPKVPAKSAAKDDKGAKGKEPSKPNPSNPKSKPKTPAESKIEANQKTVTEAINDIKIEAKQPVENNHEVNHEANKEESPVVDSISEIQPKIEETETKVEVVSELSKHEDKPALSVDRSDTKETDNLPNETAVEVEKVSQVEETHEQVQNDKEKTDLNIEPNIDVANDANKIDTDKPEVSASEVQQETTEVNAVQE